MPVEKNSYENYQLICVGLNHEADVINHRIVWAVLYSAGLFSASAILINVLVNGPYSPAGYSIIFFIMACISASGSFFSWRVKSAVRAAKYQVAYLVDNYQAQRAEFDMLGLPRPFGDPDAHDRGNSAAKTFPDLMFYSWTTAMLLELVLVLVFHIDGLRGFFFDFIGKAPPPA